jgi:hypothetical protein
MTTFRAGAPNAVIPAEAGIQFYCLNESDIEVPTTGTPEDMNVLRLAGNTGHETLVAGAGFEPAIPRLRDYEPAAFPAGCICPKRDGLTPLGGMSPLVAGAGFEPATFGL